MPLQLSKSVILPSTKLSLAMVRLIFLAIAHDPRVHKTDVAHARAIVIKLEHLTGVIDNMINADRKPINFHVTSNLLKAVHATIQTQSPDSRN